MPKLSKKELADQKKEQKKKDIEIKERFIDVVRSRDVLWNKVSKNYKNREMKDAAWAEVFKLCPDMGNSKEELQKKWKSIVDNFRSIFNTVTTSRSGEEYDEEKEYSMVKWPHFQQLMFLKDSIAKRKTTSNFECEVNCPMDPENSTSATATNDNAQTQEMINVCGDDGAEYSIEVDECSAIPETQTQQLNLGASTSTASTSQKSSEETASTSQKSSEETASTSQKSSEETASTSQKSSEETSSTHTRSASATPTFGGTRSLNSSKAPKSFSRKKKPNDEGTEPIMTELAKLNKQIDNCPVDDVSKFTDYLGTILRRLPENKRQDCEVDLLNLATNYLRNRNSVENDK